MNLLHYEPGVGRFYYLVTRCEKCRFARITFIFKATAGWLVISCHKRGFYKTAEIRLKNEKNSEREATLNAFTYKTHTVNYSLVHSNQDSLANLCKQIQCGQRLCVGPVASYQLLCRQYKQYIHRCCMDMISVDL